jgi:hypothetical protein
MSPLGLLAPGRSFWDLFQYAWKNSILHGVFHAKLFTPFFTHPDIHKHSISNCSISSSALATSASAGGTPAVGLDATGSQLIFFSNICLCRYWVGGAMTGDTVAYTTQGSTAGTITFYEINHSSVNNFARGIVSSGGFAKALMPNVA